MPKKALPRASHLVVIPTAESLLLDETDLGTTTRHSATDSKGVKIGFVIAWIKDESAGQWIRHGEGYVGWSVLIDADRIITFDRDLIRSDIAIMVSALIARM